MCVVFFHILILNLFKISFQSQQALCLAETVVNALSFSFNNIQHFRLFVAFHNAIVSYFRHGSS